MRTLGEVMVTGAMFHLCALAVLAWQHGRRGGREPGRLAAGFLFATSIAASLALSTRIGSLAQAVAPCMAVAVTLGGYAAWRRELRFDGALAWGALVVLTLSTVAWGGLYLWGLPLSLPTRILLFGGAALVLVGLPASIVTQRESLEPLLRRRWRRQAEPDLTGSLRRFPFVSIQVPCHAEPPALVIETLDHLAALEYPAFEVVVIDNNTSDPRLWHPVQTHCARLGPRFRFLHVEGISGAKAGALNWAASHIDKRAELIAVVDADYHVDPRWLRATVGFFDDPSVGFVQPPHAYRQWQHRRFGRMANWEYTMFFASGMVALQEHDAGITVGTMSIIRRSALHVAGGWAEWCLTEDSEVAIRIHELGYRSIYLREPLGRGLIPRTFESYRRQRFRWTYGPVQELRAHWREFLPRALGGAPTLDPSQRVHHANHGLDVAMIGLRGLAWPFAIATAVSMVAHHEHAAVPFVLWLAATVALISSVVVRWLQFCKVTGAPLAGAVGAVVAYQALTHAIIVASLSACIGRPATWNRTDKFSNRPHTPLRATRMETVIGLSLMCASAAVFVLGFGGLTTMFAIGFAMQGAVYLSSPIVALVAAADHDLTREEIELSAQTSVPEYLAAAGSTRVSR
jgi:Glycosyltransferase like family 2